MGRMQPDFWHDRWARQQIGFHEPAANPLLVKHFGTLALQPGARVFLPLCGKSLDIDWLLVQGYRVAASELSAIAVKALFARLGLAPTVETAGPLQCWRAGQLEVWVGDHFQVDPRQLGHVDAVYDRAALIAMPATMRPDYAAQLVRLAGDAPQLLVTLEYDQSCIDGPPFSVPEGELRRLYPGRELRRLASAAVEGGLKGRCPASEQVWHVAGAGGCA